VFKRAALILALALPVFAQTAEYGRTDAGDLQLVTKNAKPLSGSLTLGTNKFKAATFGGALVADRIWFFAAAQQSQNVLTTRFAPQLANVQLPAQPVRAIDGKAIAQIGEKQTLDASMISASQYDVTKAFSMNYTAIVSPNAFFTVSVSQHANHAQ
jgi:hypothetical protein